MYNEDESHQFLGGQGGGGAGKFGSAETSSKLDKEVRKVIDECYERAFTILTENRDKLDLMADALMKYETIDSKQIDTIMEGRIPDAPEGWTEKHAEAEPVKSASEQVDDVKSVDSSDDDQDDRNNGEDDQDQNKLH